MEIPEGLVMLVFCLGDQVLGPARPGDDAEVDAGVIGPQQGAGPRPIIMDQQQLLAIFNGNGSGDGAAEGAAGAGEALSGGEFANQEEPQ